MADATTFDFEILTLQRLLLREPAEFVIAPGKEGVFEILAHHAPYVFALQPGPLRMRTAAGTDEYFAVGGGFLVVQKERTTVLTRSVERPAEVEIERATRARERAEKRLANRFAPDIDVPRAQASLQRALARLKVAEYRSLRQ